MASILRTLKGKHSAYLAAYFGLLLFGVSGLVLQGGIWMVAGVVGWFSVVVACLLLRYRGNGAKNLKDAASRSEGYLGSEREGF
jgi:K+ transporter